MEFSEIEKRALEIRKVYKAFEIKEHGREWTRTEIFQGLIADLGDFSRMMVAEQGVWPKYAECNQQQLKQKMAHELSDCLWSIIVLADKYDIEIEEAFVKNMDEIEKKFG